MGKALRQLGDDLRVLRTDVALLQGVGCQIVQLEVGLEKKKALAKILGF